MKRVSRTGGVYWGIVRSLSCLLRLRLFEQGDEIVQFLDRGVDIVLLRPQRRDPLTAARDRHVALGAAAVADIVEVDHLADLAQREADALAAQYPREPRAIAMRIDALRPPPLGRDQPLVPIKTTRARTAPDPARTIPKRKKHPN